MVILLENIKFYYYSYFQQTYGVDLLGLGLISTYIMIKFVKFDSIKQPDPIPLEVKRHPCVYGHPCLESREEEVDRSVLLLLYLLSILLN